MNYLVLKSSPCEQGIIFERCRLIAEHMKNILKKEVGEEVKIKVLDSGVGIGVIEAMGHSGVKIRVKELEKPSCSLPRITFAIGACRPLMTKRILEHGATLGVEKFIFFKSEHSEKSYLSSSVFKAETYNKYLTKGLAQTRGRFHLPTVEIVEKIENIDLNTFDKKIYLHGPGNSYLKQGSFLEGDWIIFLGSERGWHPNEFSYFQKMKIEETAISSSVLRVEFAMASVMAQIDWIKNACN